MAMGRMLAGVATALAIAGGAVAQAPDLSQRIAQYEQLVKDTGDPGVRWLLAEAYAAAGRREDAVRTLNQVADLRLGFLPGDDSPLAKLAGDPAYDAVRARLEADLPRVRRGRTAHTIRRPGLVPEGIAYDELRGRFYLGDMHSRSVVSLDRGGRLSVIADGLKLPPLGMKVDAARGRLWVASTNAFWDAADKRAELLAFELGAGRRLGAWTHPEAKSFNDVDVAPNGDVYLTDSLGGAVFRLRGEALERVTPAGAMGYPNGLAVSGDGRRLYVAQGAALRRVDLETGAVSPVRNLPNLSTMGIDGLYWRDGALLAVQNVATPGRVVRLELSPEGDRIAGFRFLEAGDPAFDIPTTAALGRDRLFLLANSQIDRLLPDGSLDPRRPLAPIRIVEVPLG